MIQVEAYQEWKDDASETSHCDFAPIVVVTSWNEEIKVDMTELVKHHGVNTFKVFMAYKVSWFWNPVAVASGWESEGPGFEPWQL